MEHSWLPWPVFFRIPSALVICLLCWSERLWESSETKRANRSTNRGATSWLWDAPPAGILIPRPCPRTMSGSQSSVWSGLDSLYLWGGFRLKGWALHPSATGFTGLVLRKARCLQSSFGGESDNTSLRGRRFWNTTFTSKCGTDGDMGKVGVQKPQENSSKHKWFQQLPLARRCNKTAAGFCLLFNK